MSGDLTSYYCATAPAFYVWWAGSDKNFRLRSNGFYYGCKAI